MKKALVISLLVLSVVLLFIAGYWGYSVYNDLNDQINADKLLIIDKESKITQLMSDNSTLQQSVSNLNTNIQELKDKYEKKIVQKTGKIKFSFGFPSEFLPARRICFSNVSDISKMYCYWQKNTNDKKSYSNDLEVNEVTLPVGKYIVDYSSYTFSNLGSQNALDVQNISDSFALKQCVYYANGDGSSKSDTYCKSANLYFSKMSDLMGNELVYTPNQIVNYNDFGGDVLIFEVKEGKTTTIDTISLMPYFDLNL